jgi:hypothetical protein
MRPRAGNLQYEGGQDRENNEDAFSADDEPSPDREDVHSGSRRKRGLGTNYMEQKSETPTKTDNFFSISGLA